MQHVNRSMILWWLVFTYMSCLRPYNLLFCSTSAFLAHFLRLQAQENDLASCKSAFQIARSIRADEVKTYEKDGTAELLLHLVGWQDAEMLEIVVIYLKSSIISIKIKNEQTNNL